MLKIFLLYSDFKNVLSYFEINSPFFSKIKTLIRMKDFPNRDGNWSWEELETLGKALGYHPKIFFDQLSTVSSVAGGRESSSGIKNDKTFPSEKKYEDLVMMFQSDLFYPVLNKTYNHHDGAYNLKVISKSIYLLQKRFISFAQLQCSRVSFQTYEGSDHAGLEDKFVMRALKLCNKIMAPERLKQLLQHLDRLVSDRLMLYEFLDLVSSADSLLKVEKQIERKKQNENLDDRGLYEIYNFKEELLTNDDRCHKKLNKDFEDMLKIIPLNKSQLNKNSFPKNWATPPLVNKAYREAKTLTTKTEGEILHHSVRESGKNIQNYNKEGRCHCKNGLTFSGEMSSNSMISESPQPIEKLSTKNWKSTPVSKEIEWKRPALVVDTDIKETKEKVQNLQWVLSTKAMKKK